MENIVLCLKFKFNWKSGLLSGVPFKQGEEALKQKHREIHDGG
jgi:hypothetical protein